VAVKAGAGRLAPMKLDLIDDVLEQTPERIVVLKQVTRAEEYLADHFPTFPVLPGVMMIETMAQAARRLLADRSPTPLVLGSVRSLKFGMMVRPTGDSSAGAWGGSAGPAPGRRASRWTRQPSVADLPCGRSAGSRRLDPRRGWGFHRPCQWQEALAMSRDQIYQTVRDILEEALGADEEEITPQATLTGDLEAESIDFLDIVFRLEKAFSTDGRPFKISQGELFPENLMENPSWVSDGKFTDEGMQMLRDRMPHVDFERFEHDRQVDKVAELMTVDSIVTFVERKLAA
jgi:acyl carrier protein